jgi:C_GCAxxG_C_C family probable redox protein
MTEVNAVVSRFSEGFACSQALFLGFAPRFGLDANLAARISAPFGGGMGRMGEVCGAVSGALMVIGLASGNATAQDRPSKDRAYQLVREFAARFRTRHGSLLCRDLLGCDLSQPGALELARDCQLFATRCPGLVRDAAEIVAELLCL